MDVSPLNLGMIAAYYNISCECLPSIRSISFSPLYRRHGRGVHALAEGTDEDEGSARGDLVIGRV